MFRLVFSLSSLLLLVAASCTDGKDNLVEIEDVSGGNFVIHFKAVKGYTYDHKNASSCKSGDAEVCFPGYIKLSSGTITVTQANDLNKTGEVKATLKKNSLLVGTVCKDGKSKTIGVSDKDCHGTIMSLLGPSFTQMLSTPGTYDLAQIEATGGFSNVIPLKNVPGSLNEVMKGEWQAQFALYAGSKQIGDIKLPYDRAWLYLS